MSKLEEKIKKVPKKLCKALKSRLFFFSERISKKHQKRTARSPYSRHYSQSVLSFKESLGASHSFYFTKRTNHMLLTCQDYQDTADLLKTHTFHGVFLASGEVKSSKIFTLSNKDKNNSCSHQAIIHISPLSFKMSRAKSIENLEASSSHSFSCTKAITKKVKFNNIGKYSKFIPVFDAWGEKYPRGSISDRSLLCWLDLQAWYVNYLEEKMDNSSLLEINMDSHRGCDDMELFRPSFHNKNQVREIQEKRAVDDDRFGKRNEEYLQTFTKEPEDDDSLSIQIYAKMSNKSSMNLCRLKSEMIVCCLQNFFKPYDNFDLMWVADLDSHVAEIRDNRSCDIFKRLVMDMVDLANIMALVYLPPIPAAKLRHKDLGLLDTIAKTLDLDPDQVLFLPMDKKMFLW